jgi:hypothetical protein
VPREAHHGGAEVAVLLHQPHHILTKRRETAGLGAGGRRRKSSFVSFIHFLSASLLLEKCFNTHFAKIKEFGGGGVSHAAHLSSGVETLLTAAETTSGLLRKSAGARVIAIRALRREAKSDSDVTTPSADVDLTFFFELSSLFAWHFAAAGDRRVRAAPR